MKKHFSCVQQREILLFSAFLPIDLVLWPPPLCAEQADLAMRLITLSRAQAHQGCLHRSYAAGLQTSRHLCKLNVL